MLKRYNKLILIELLHALPIAVLTYITLNNLTHVHYLLYLLFISIFSLTVFFSIFLLVHHQRGAFFYLFSVLMFLGLPFKFSMHEITRFPYIEPIGLFDFSNASYTSTIETALYAGVGILLAQIFSYLLFIKNKNILIKNKIERPNSTNFKTILIFGIIALGMSIVNLKYNIILFGITPSIILPLKGNTIYFLILTRFLPILLLYYGVNSFSYFKLSIGALIFMITSIGVTSRMVIVVYFMVITIPLLQNLENSSILKFLKKISFIIILFAAASYLTVQTSSKLRYVFNQENNSSLASNETKSSNDQVQSISKNRDLIDTMKAVLNTGSISKYANYTSLATERWIGMEGLMAVVAHPNKGFSFFIQALKESGFKNDGKSFYNSVADLKLMKMLKDIKNPTNISTSVPGPVAFFYYSGSVYFVFISMLFFCMGIYLIENFFVSIFQTREYVAAYISVFITFDFYQFGISPIAFLKYWAFSFACIAIWLSYDKIKKIIASKYLILRS